MFPVSSGTLVRLQGPACARRKRSVFPGRRIRETSVVPEIDRRNRLLPFSQPSRCARDLAVSYLFDVSESKELPSCRAQIRDESSGSSPPLCLGFLDNRARRWPPPTCS